MTLSEWLEITRSELNEFAEFWESQCRTDSKLFPADMGAADWDEQFTSYTALRRPVETAPEGK